MADDKKPDEPQVSHPKGAALFAVIFMVVLIAMWVTVYLILLSRGVTI